MFFGHREEGRMGMSGSSAGWSFADSGRELLCPILKKVFGEIDCISPKACSINIW